MHQIQIFKLIQRMLLSVASSLLLCLSLLIDLTTCQAPAQPLGQIQVISSPVIIEGQSVPISICFGDCSSCQENNGDCETCFRPWFNIIEGSCQISGSPLNPHYILESTAEEQRSTNFIPSTAWISNFRTVATTVCRDELQIFNKTFSIAGFFTEQPVNYRRTVSQHDYFGMKFLLLLADWNTESSLVMTVTNEDNELLGNQTFDFTNEQVRMAEQVSRCQGIPYKKLDVSLQMFDRTSRQIKIQFTPTIVLSAGRNPRWGFTSFVLITGKCNETCQTCFDFSPQVKYCSICTNFRANSDEGRCSTCVSGFRPNQIGCQKCQILYQTCQEDAESCNYPNFTSLVPDRCTFDNNEQIKDQLSVSNPIQFSTLFQLAGVGSRVVTCGQYSIVGPAYFGQLIERTFLTMPPHIELSLNFNVFIFDQGRETERYSLAIIVDGSPVSLDPNLQNIVITGFSNQCGDYQKVDAMKAFQTRRFIPHTSQNNVRIGISLQSSEAVGLWGIRDIRIVYRRCDQNCQNCTENGCERCKGLLQLVDGACTGCPGGTGYDSSNPDFCVPCFTNCLRCLIVGNKNTCTTCFEGYYLYEFKGKQTCEKIPNYGTPVQKGETIGGNSIDPNSTDCSRILGRRIAQALTEAEGNGTTVAPIETYELFQFEIAENKLIKRYSLSGHYKYKIQFFLMKIDDWENDRLDIYVNDLLIHSSENRIGGNQLCADEAQPEQIFFQQQVLKDNNKTITVQFEVVHSQLPHQPRRFGISKLQFYPIGCPQCEDYDFFYRILYTTDTALNVEMSFNLIYKNDDPEEFKNIFRLKVDGQQTKYELIRNDSIRYWLAAQLPSNVSEIIEQNVTVQCKYPHRVVTQIKRNNEEEFKTFFNTRKLFEGSTRLMQANDISFQNSKTLDSSNADVEVQRYTPLDGFKKGITGLGTFFQVMTRIVVYVGFASFFFGCQTPFTHLMHNFQKIWVHIYVATLTMSPILKTALIGFRQCQDQNIAIMPDRWETGLPEFLYYDAPAQYQQYYHDITFFRNIYNVGLAAAILLVLYVVAFLVLRKKQLGANTQSDRFIDIFKRHIKITFSQKPIFFLNSVIFYQYFTTVLACCLQFIDLQTNTNGYEGFAGVNAAACIIAFVFATLYPLLFHGYLRFKRRQSYEIIRSIKLANNENDIQKLEKQAKQLQYSNVGFNNRYAEVFFRFLPKNLWNKSLAEIDLIKETQFFYNIVRFGELWWYAILVCLVFYAPFAQAFLLMLTNLAHVLLFIIYKLNTTRIYKYLKGIQMLLFMGIEILLLVMYSLSETLRPDSYQALGVVAVVLVFLIIVVSILRTGYTFYQLWTEYRYPGKYDDRLVPVIRFLRGFKGGYDDELNGFNHQ